MQSAISFGKCFINTFGPVMEEMGYARKGYTFHRLVNSKVIQEVSYKKYSGGSYTIQWSSTPLLFGDEITTFMDAYTIAQLVEKGEPMSWYYTNDLDEYDEITTIQLDTWAKTQDIFQHYEKQMPHSLEVCKKRLFPFLDSIYDYESYLDRMNWMYMTPENTVGIPISNPDVYHLNLYLGNYEAAWKSAKAHYNNILRGQQLSELSPNWRERMKRRMDNYHQMKAAVERGDRETIDSYLRQNEEFSLQSYIQNYYGKRALEKYLKSEFTP